MDIKVKPENNANIKYDDVDLTNIDPEELKSLGLYMGDTEEEEEEEDNTEEGEEEDLEDIDADEEDESDSVNNEKEYKIPKSRFDEVNERAIRAEERTRYLEERIEQLLALQEKLSSKQEPDPEPEEEYDFDAAEDKYAELILEGEPKEAAKLRREINKEKDKQVKNLIESIKKQTQEDIVKTTKNLSESEKKSLVIKDAVSKYPSLDHESDEYDEELVEEINSIAYGYQVNKNMSPSEALSKAINRMVKPKETTDKTDVKKKKVEKMIKQPPSTVESSSPKIKDKKAVDFDWENMSQAEFEKLYKKNPGIIKEAMNKIYI